MITCRRCDREFEIVGRDRGRTCPPCYKAYQRQIYGKSQLNKPFEFLQEAYHKQLARRPWRDLQVEV